MSSPTHPLAPPDQAVRDLLTCLREFIPNEVYRTMFTDLYAHADNNGNPSQPIAGGAEHFHSGNFIQCSESLKGLIKSVNEAEFGNDDVTVTALKTVLGYWSSANALKQLERFADWRQPALEERPLPDGSNMKGVHDLLIHEWQFRRLWIRYLHFPGILMAKNNDKRVVSLRNLYEIGRAVSPQAFY